MALPLQKINKKRVYVTKQSTPVYAEPFNEVVDAVNQITQLTNVIDTTDVSDTATQLNALLAELRTAGILKV
jgi:hypothetical protein